MTRVEERRLIRLIRRVTLAAGLAHLTLMLTLARTVGPLPPAGTAGIILAGVTGLLVAVLPARIMAAQATTGGREARATAASNANGRWAATMRRSSRRHDSSRTSRSASGNATMRSSNVSHSPSRHRSTRRGQHAPDGTRR